MHVATEIAEVTMATYWQYYESGALEDSVALHQSFGHDPAALEFTYNPDSYYFPNVRGNLLVRPESVSDDKIPVLALENGITYYFQPPHIHYLQKIALARAGFQPAHIARVARQTSEISDEVRSSGGEQGTASIFHRLAPDLLSPKGYVETSPVLILNINPSVGPLEEDLTSVVQHELVHVSQTFTQPLRQLGDSLSDLSIELEAYGSQAQLVSNFAVPYNLSTAMAGTVDNFRRKYLGVDRFAATQEFLDLFAKDDILKKILSAID